LVIINGVRVENSRTLLTKRDQDSETAQSSYQSQQQVGFAQIKAFDQDVIVRERDEQITGLNDKAVAINSLGKVINLKIHEQDEKLDIMADNTNQADDNIGDAVKELDEAATISKKGCGKCWLLLKRRLSLRIQM